MIDKFLDVSPGRQVTAHGETWIIKSSIPGGLVVALSATDLTNYRVLAVRDLSQSAEAQVLTDAELNRRTFVPKEKWEAAEARAQTLQKLVQQGTLSADARAEACKELKISTAQLYRLLASFKAFGTIGLVKANPGVEAGTLKVSPPTYALFIELVDSEYLNQKKLSPAAFIKKVRRALKGSGLHTPHENTLRNWLNNLPAKLVAKHRGTDRDREQHELTSGTSPQGWKVFSDYQIDHAQLNLVAVDDETRKPISRPWITLIIEVRTRMVAGFYISLEKPSGHSVAMAIVCALCPKEKLLEEYGVPGTWDIWGKPDSFHADNGKDFRGRGLRAGLRKRNILLQWRPVKKPRYGAHIERLIGTFANEVMTWDGTTHASAEKRGDYDSEANAIYTLDEIKKLTLEWIVNQYHQHPHEGLGKRSPYSVYAEEISNTLGGGYRAIPTDEDLLEIDFLEYFERVIRPDGVEIDTVMYSERDLEPYVGIKNTSGQTESLKYIFRRSIIAISPIYFLDPKTNTYTPIHYANTSRPVVARWQLDQARKEILKNKEKVEEGKIFESIGRNDEVRRSAKASLKKARDEEQRLREVEKEKKRAKKRHADKKATQETVDAPEIGTLAAPPAVDDEYVQSDWSEAGDY